MIHLLETIFKFYVGLVLLALAIFALLGIPCIISSPKSKIRYYAKFIMVYYATLVGTSLLGPIFLLRPRNVKNIQIISWLIRKCSYLMGITWEVRNSKVLEGHGGALVCANHQSSIDILTMFSVWGAMKKVTAVAKIEMLYMVPFGPAAWLAGISFINRKSPKESYKTLGNCAKRMKEEDIKMFIYPEGTRNKERGLLPFKKGAFKTAIMGQVPIIPIIISPYYFIDPKNYIFDKGHIVIKVLDPIPTQGMVDSDHEKLMEQTREVMLAEYNKLAAEIDSSRTDEKWRNKSRPRLTLDSKSN